MCSLLAGRKKLTQLEVEAMERQWRPSECRQSVSCIWNSQVSSRFGAEFVYLSVCLFICFGCQATLDFRRRWCCFEGQRVGKVECVESSLEGAQLSSGLT